MEVLIISRSSLKGISEGVRSFVGGESYSLSELIGKLSQAIAFDEDWCRMLIERTETHIEVPEGVTRIAEFAFGGWTSLTSVVIPNSVRNIGGDAFSGCGLTSVTFEGKPDNIYQDCFRACFNLTTINVPWSEGEVANAPWGAINATINYNYTGE